MQCWSHAGHDNNKQTPGHKQLPLFREKRSTAKTPRPSRFKTSSLETMKLDGPFWGVRVAHPASPSGPSHPVFLAPWRFKDFGLRLLLTSCRMPHHARSFSHSARSAPCRARSIRSRWKCPMPRCIDDPGSGRTWGMTAPACEKFLLTRGFVCVFCSSTLMCGNNWA